MTRKLLKALGWDDLGGRDALFAIICVIACTAAVLLLVEPTPRVIVDRDGFVSFEEMLKTPLQGPKPLWDDFWEGAPYQ